MRSPSDQQIDLSVATMLRLGVTLAALTVLVGGALLLAHPFAPAPNYTHFQEGNGALRSLSGIARGTLHLSPLSIIQLGLVLLIATPVARVVLCVVGFARQRKSLYVVISLTVLAILTYSVLHS